MRRPTSAGLCRLNQASLSCDSQLSKENTPGHENQFGIIRKAALYEGFGPGTVEKFQQLWKKAGGIDIEKPVRRKVGNLFDF
jgi:hypothetical protein